MNEPGRRAVLATLKRFADSGPWDTPDFGGVLADESDRGAVTILVSIIDDVLAAAIERKFRPLTADEKSRLFGFEAPLGSFSARIKMGYALGVIDAEDRDDLDVMRNMRNAAAHARGRLSFADTQFSNALALLFAEGEMRDHIRAGEHPGLGKLHFIAVIRYLMAKIDGLSKEEATIRADDLYDLMLQEMKRVAAEGDANP